MNRRAVTIDPNNRTAEYAGFLCERLEQGDILTLERTPFLPSAEEMAFLRGQRQSASSTHKNIAYKPEVGRITGVAGQAEVDAERTRCILAEYSRGALAFLAGLFPHYAARWKVDYASFRPLEEHGRNISIRQRNDLMHVDAFPTRPTHGGRILRAFTNIHPTKDRVWAIAAPFDALAEKYAAAAGLLAVTRPHATVARKMKRLVHRAVPKVPDRSAYDEFMLLFHHYLKTNEEFQGEGKLGEYVFSPGTTWICFTDQVAHAVLSGQYAVEQTCIVPLSCMKLPDCSPMAVLERLARRSLR
ncbi:MAG: Kdo hydroxylase family protein [Armatimonadetes bacterium]|nr:Kdo hydroxylase family protein [Armatimonadota bacterium]MDE2207731.1 Kdo hydroxylase family protein [Armatimonadota bacterium]